MGPHHQFPCHNMLTAAIHCVYLSLRSEALAKHNKVCTGDKPMKAAPRPPPPAGGGDGGSEAGHRPMTPTPPPQPPGSAPRAAGGRPRAGVGGGASPTKPAAEEVRGAEHAPAVLMSNPPHHTRMLFPWMITCVYNTRCTVVKLLDDL